MPTPVRRSSTTSRTSAATRTQSTTKKKPAAPKLKASSTNPAIVDVKVSGKKSIDVSAWTRSLRGLTAGLVLTVQIGTKTVRVDADRAFERPPGIPSSAWSITPTAQGLMSVLARELRMAGHPVRIEEIGFDGATWRLHLTGKQA